MYFDLENKIVFRFLCKLCAVPLEKAQKNWQEYRTSVLQVASEHNIEVNKFYVDDILERKVNAEAMRTGIKYNIGFVKLVLNSEKQVFTHLVAGHELSHILNKDKRMCTLSPDFKIKKTMIEVRCDIEGRNLMHISKEDAATARKEVHQNKRDYKKALSGYPSMEDRVRYLNDFDTFEEAKETVLKDYDK